MMSCNSKENRFDNNYRLLVKIWVREVVFAVFTAALLTNQIEIWDVKHL